MRYRFDEFELDCRTLELRQNGAVVSVEPQVLSLLIFLIDQRERVVSRQDLIEAVWDGRFISDSAVSSRVKSARRALGDDGRQQRYIKTIHGRGFRFVAELSEDSSQTEVPQQVAAPREAPPSSIAVLPFNNMSAESDQAFFADGLCEDIITMLAKIPGLVVAARNSSFVYRDQAVDVRQVGRELNVATVLEGSVRRAGDQLRVTGQLIDASTGEHLWAERYDRPVEDIFALQDEMTREIVSALQVSLSKGMGDKARLIGSGTRNFDAWEHATRARYAMFSNDRHAIRSALGLAGQAIELDAGYAAAYTCLAFAHWKEIINGWSTAPAESARAAKEAATRAVELDPENADTLVILAYLSVIGARHDDAMRFAARALARSPSDPTVLGCAAYVDLYSDNAVRAPDLARRGFNSAGQEGAFYLAIEAAAHYVNRNYDKAIACAQETLQADSSYAAANLTIALSHVENDRLAEAQEWIAKALSTNPSMRISTFSQATDYADPETVKRIRVGLRRAGLPD